MGLIHKDTFVCFDCESTGLDPQKDHIIEIAVCKFTFDEITESREDLIDPGLSIPEHTIEIHHITDEMVAGKPKIRAVLRDYLKIIDNHILVGHAIPFDIGLLDNEAKRCLIETQLPSSRYLDTLRLARLYGESPTNSLESLRKHFNIVAHGAHRAMNDVIVNIEVFKHLTRKFKTTEEVLKRLEKPINLRQMPLGKHKGRPFREIPFAYLRWASHQNFDQDLLFSLRSEIKKRKQGNLFSQAGNPFTEL
ncbi:MAG: DNA polymerase III PolC-type [Chlamydiae bacterium]|nr:DNA polymerase III PolC-type [Chlamydiota bacterium]